MLINPDVIKSRYFQQKWEEICRLFTTGVEKALVSFYYPTGYYLDPRHTCVLYGGDYKECQSCVEDMQFINSFEKIFNIEQDLWNNYLSYKKVGLTNKFGSMMDYENPNSNFNPASFDNFMDKSKINYFDQNNNSNNNNNDPKSGSNNDLGSLFNPSIFHDKNLNTNIPIENYLLTVIIVTTLIWITLTLILPLICLKRKTN